MIKTINFFDNFFYIFHESALKTLINISLLTVTLRTFVNINLKIASALSIDNEYKKKIKCIYDLPH